MLFTFGDERSVMMAFRFCQRDQKQTKNLYIQYIVIGMQAENNQDAFFVAVAVICFLVFFYQSYSGVDIIPQSCSWDLSLQ